MIDVEKSKEKIIAESEAVEKMTIRRIDAIRGQLFDCELYGYKKRAYLFKRWLDYLERVRRFTWVVREKERQRGKSKMNKWKMGILITVCCAVLFAVITLSVWTAVR